MSATARDTSSAASDGCEETYYWVHVAYEQEYYVRSSDGAVVGSIRGQYRSWGAYSNGVLGEYIEERFAKAAVERAVRGGAR